ncbi:MAG TPA: metallophosphoesterase [Bryobacteraceae bacterium]|nr:metallophosphoesterase [Bryobacteraceae bacterium]
MRLSIILILCAAAAANAADKLVGGPYVVIPAPRSATIGWVVETDGATVTGPSGEPRRLPVLRSEKVTLTGLKPGELMRYEIPASAGLAEADRKGQFMVPPVGEASFQFVVFGDTRTRHDLHRRVINAIAETKPAFVLHTGDLVSDGYDTAQWPLFFSIEKELLRNTVFFPVLGNHERDNARFYEFFDVKKPYYSFNWGSAHFVVIDSDLTNLATSSAEREQFWAEQTRWLEEDLQRSAKADFRIVVMHHPPYTVNQKGSHMSRETPTLVPLFEKYNVQAVFGGHDHNYQRHVKNGIQYVVTGGGGAPLAPADPPLPGLTVKVESIEHFVTVRVEGKKARMEAVALDGRVIEAIDLNP